MRIYHYDETGMYTHATDARQDPLEAGRFLIPARSVAVAPPEVAEGYRAVWDGSGWQQVVDARGRYYNQNREEVWILDIGVDVPDGWTTEPRPFSQEEILRQKMKEAADTVAKIIQDRVDAYNEAHGLAFSDVHNCESYSRVTTYSHRQFCEDVWLWNVEMWETARAIQGEVVAGQMQIPTAEEFIAMLPEYTGVE